MRILLVSLLWCSALTANADLIGPTEIAVGKKIVLQCDDQVDLIFWSLPTNLEAEIVEKNTKVFLWGNVGKYAIVCNVVTLDWEQKQVLDQKQYQHVLTITGDTPTPIPPDPPDPPTPNPDLSGLSKDIYEWAMAVDNPYRSKANQLSDNYLSISVKLDQMEVTVPQALEELRALNNAVLNTRELKDAWAVFGSRLQERMVSEWPMERVVFVKFLEDISKGLAHVK